MKKQPIDLELAEPCIGCGEKPVDIGRGGQYKLVCATYQAGKVVKSACVSNDLRMVDSPTEAVNEWNRFHRNLKTDIEKMRKAAVNDLIAKGKLKPGQKVKWGRRG